MVFDDRDVAFTLACTLIFGLSWGKAVAVVITLLVMAVVGVAATIEITLVRWDVNLSQRNRMHWALDVVLVCAVSGSRTND